MVQNSYSVVLNTLKHSHLTKYFSSGAGVSGPDISDRISFSENVINIFLDNNNLCYRNEDDDIIISLYVNVDISNEGYWLSSFLVGINF
jgi:hypothetical protein